MSRMVPLVYLLDPKGGDQDVKVTKFLGSQGQQGFPLPACPYIEDLHVAVSGHLHQRFQYVGVLQYDGQIDNPTAVEGTRRQEEVISEVSGFSISYFVHFLICPYLARFYEI